VRQINTPSRKWSHIVRYGDNLGGVFSLATRVGSYPLEVKIKMIEMRIEIARQLSYRAWLNMRFLL
jgi:transposase